MSRIDEPPASDSAEKVVSAIETADDVRFEVKGVGIFRASRLTGRLTMQVYAKRDELLRSEMGLKGDLRDAPADAVFAAEAMATLMLVGMDCVEPERIGAWQGPLDSQDDVILEVYHSYFRAKRIVVARDEQAKEDAKNSSGGAAT